MFTDTLDALGEAAEKKLAYARRMPFGYLLTSLLAGVYVGVAVFLVIAVGGPLHAAGSPWLKTLMGASFGVALSLVVFAGAELFTGNNMVMAIGWWQRRTSGRALLAIWGLSWVGNLLGAVLLAVALRYSGILEGDAERTLLQTLAARKMGLSIVELVLRGMLCNMLVCLGVWCAFRMKSEAGKLIMIFWCLYAFIAAGLEHSVANMTLLPLAMLQQPLADLGATLTWSGVGYNLLWVSLGNIIGGMCCVGGAYWLASGRPRAVPAPPAESPSRSLV